MKDIGNVLSFREAVDTQKRVTKHIRANLATVDIIPVDYTLKMSALTREEMAIEYDFMTPINIYQKICNSYKLKSNYGGIRLWLTDDTQAFEEYSHHFSENTIERGINSLSGRGRELRQILQSTGNSSMVNEMLSRAGNLAMGGVERGVNAAVNFTVDAMPGTHTGQDQDIKHNLSAAIVGAAKTAASIVFQGKQVSLPQIWSGSEYHPTLTLNLKLVSPYGYKDAIAKFIIEPLLYILIMSAPRTTDGLSYGLYQPVKIKGYGLSNINLGAIQSVSVRRGGRSTAYNVWKQPLILDVAIQIQPLCGGFAVMEPDVLDVADATDANKLYVENKATSPAITTVGNVIQSLRPAPQDVVEQRISTASLSGNRLVDAQGNSIAHGGAGSNNSAYDTFREEPNINTEDIVAQPQTW